MLAIGGPGFVPPIVVFGLSVREYHMFTIWADEKAWQPGTHIENVGAGRPKYVTSLGTGRQQQLASCLHSWERSNEGWLKISGHTPSHHARWTSHLIPNIDFEDTQQAFPDLLCRLFTISLYL